MIGNDIVDLNQAGKAHRWQDPRFTRKLFTDSELDHLYAQPDPFEAIWRLWSMKESSYKAYSRITGKTFINPHNIVCEVESSTKGKAYIEQRTYLVNSTTTNDYVYSLATAIGQTAIIDQVHKTANHSVAGIRVLRNKLLFNEIGRIENTRGILSIMKNQNGAPFLLQDEVQLKLPITLTHHGHYFAFAVGERASSDKIELNDHQPNKVGANQKVLV